jgi:hypothetical protein
VARKFVGDQKVTLEWSMPHETRDKTEVKLLLNLMLMAISAVPRGGLVTVGPDGAGMVVSATGEGAKLPEASRGCWTATSMRPRSMPGWCRSTMRCGSPTRRATGSTPQPPRRRGDHGRARA